jgi:TPR repeat protein
MKSKKYTHFNKISVFASEMKILSEKGNAEAQYHFGQLLKWGLGVKKNITEAYHWIRASADQGNSNGQLALSYFYMDGYFLEKDQNEALKWLQLSVDQGNASAQFALGVEVYDPTNVTQANNLYKLAALQNDMYGQEQYAHSLYDSGNLVESARWFKLSAIQGNESAQRFLAYLYRKGEGLQKNNLKASVWLAISIRESLYGKNTKRIANKINEEKIYINQFDLIKIKKQARKIARYLFSMKQKKANSARIQIKSKN